MKFRIEEIVVPEQVQVAKLFECPICLGVLHDPVQTSCAHIFCSDCLQKTRNGLCPACKVENEAADIKPLKDVNLPMYRMMGQILVVCPYRAAGPESRGVGDAGDGETAMKRQRTDQTCAWSGSYSDLLESHLGACMSAPVECSYCHLEVRRGDKSSHEEQCEHRFEICKICGDRMQSEQDHMQTAASAHVAILQAKLMQAQERGTTDASLMSKVTVMDDRVKELELKFVTEMGKCAKTAHVTQKINELKATHAPAIGEIFKFVVLGAAKLSRTYTGRREWTSPIGAPFQVSIYPNGDADASPAHFSFFVEASGCPAGHEYELEVHFGSMTKFSMDVGVGNGAMGYSEMGLKTRLAGENDEIIITLLVTKVTRLLTVVI